MCTERKQRDVGRCRVRTDHHLCLLAAPLNGENGATPQRGAIDVAGSRSMLLRTTRNIAACTTNSAPAMAPGCAWTGAIRKCLPAMGTTTTRRPVSWSQAGHFHSDALVGGGQQQGHISGGRSHGQILVPDAQAAVSGRHIV